MRTDAQKKADKEYRKKQLNNGKNKQINATIPTDIYIQIDNFCKINGISKAQFISGCCMYFINKNEIPPN